MSRSVNWNWFQQSEPPPQEPFNVMDAIKDRNRSAKNERKRVFEEVAAQINKTKKEFRGNARHDVVKAGKGSHIYLNSVTILTGSQGAGKTFATMAESLMICRANPNTHMMIFVKKKAYDPTVESTKPLIEATGCKFIEIGYGYSEDFVKMIFHYKELYNKMKRAIAWKHAGKPLEQFDEDLSDATDDEAGNMLKVLAIKDLHFDWLNTIVAFDDTGNSGLFRNPDSYFNNRLKLCRDDNACYFLVVHGITQLTPSIKQNTATVFIFKGLSNERLGIIWRQLNISLDWSQFKGCYYAIAHTAGARFMVVDNISGADPKIEG
jgi:hypothetical protein